MEVLGHCGMMTPPAIPISPWYTAGLAVRLARMMESLHQKLLTGHLRAASIVTGTLKGFDQLMNLVMDDVVEEYESECQVVSSANIFTIMFVPSVSSEGIWLSELSLLGNCTALLSVSSC